MAASRNLFKGLALGIIIGSAAEAAELDVPGNGVCESAAFATVIRDPEILLFMKEEPGLLSLTIKSEDPARAETIREFMLQVLKEKSLATHSPRHNGYGLPDY